MHVPRSTHFLALLALLLAITGARLAAQDGLINGATNTLELVDTNHVFTGGVTNFGTVRIINSSVTYSGDYVENGTYFSDPSTNTFGNLSIGLAGVLIGFTGDLFRFSGNFNNASTNWAGWNTVDAGLTAFGFGSHNLQVPGFNPGLSSSGYTNNFAWGIFTLAVNNSVVLQDGNATPGAAMFVRDLVLGGGTNQLTSITGNGNSIYYDPAGTSNAYLFNQTYALTGGGIIAPVLRSFWTNSTNLYVGYDRPGNTFLITNGTGVKASNAFVGYLAGSSNNLLRISGGTLLVTNAATNAILDIRRGTNVLTLGGVINTDRLQLTNAGGVMEFRGGTLVTRSTEVDNGIAFDVGDGTQLAEVAFEGGGSHTFANGLIIRSNATARLNTTGTLSSPGGLAIQTGGTLLFQAAHQLAGGTPVALAGGTFDLAGQPQSATLGALTLSADSTLDFGSGGTQTLVFGGLASHTSGSSLTIANWSGNLSGGGTDQLRFTGGSGVTPAFLSEVQFIGHPQGALLLGSGEIVPVPEPASWLALLALGFHLGWRSCRSRDSNPFGTD